MKEIILLTIFILSIPVSCFSLNVDSHNDLNKSVSEKTIQDFSLDLFLKNQLGMQKGIQTKINSKTKTIKDWLGEGGKKEDDPVGSWRPATWVPVRAANHLNDPVHDKGWGWGKSAIDWALLGRTEQYAGEYSWADVRQYFVWALTFSADTRIRDDNFARTFRGLGQLMHLVQDMSVPEHTRNDPHSPSEYEEYISRKYDKAKIDGLGAVGAIDQLLASPGTTLGHINPIANLFDTETYNGINPSVTTGSYIGLAEYTNANFLSADTMFKGFSYPSKKTSVTLDDEIIEDPRNPSSSEPVFRQYYRKIADGETGKDTNGYRLACVSFTDHYTSTDIYGNGSFREYSPITLDDNVFQDYSNLLMPRAVGYASGILKYFFRGKLKVTEAVAIPGDENGIKKISANKRGSHLHMSYL